MHNKNEQSECCKNALSTSSTPHSNVFCDNPESLSHRPGHIPLISLKFSSLFCLREFFSITLSCPTRSSTISRRFVTEFKGQYQVVFLCITCYDVILCIFEHVNICINRTRMAIVSSSQIFCRWHR